MAALQVVPTPGAAVLPPPAPVGAVAPPSASHPLTLYALEEQLTILADTAELVPPEQAQEFLEEFRAALTAAADKRDRVGQFLSHLETQAAFAKAEIIRLQERKAWFERAIEHMEGYVINVIESLGRDAKGKYQKLEGRTVTFGIRDCPPSVEILDEAAVPSDYKAISIAMPALQWEALLDSLELEQRASVLDSVERPKMAVSKTAIKKAIDGGGQVPGADLIVGKKTLIRK
jgi:septal ring factor EnvC (AmiA/AmiB activator)